MRLLLRYAICVIAVFAPHTARARWREEWLAEVGQVLRARGRVAASRMIAGALPDALALGRTVAEKRRRTGKRAPFHAIGQDARYAVRSLIQAPAFSLAVAGSLSLGIAVTATAFTFLNAILFRPFPGIHEQDRLVNVRLARGCGWSGCDISTSSLDDYRDLRDGLTMLEGLAAKASDSIAVTIDGRAHSLRASMVSENYFDVLGVKAALGRTFAPEEGQLARAGVVVIAHTFWMREFNGRPDVLGRFVELASGSAQVIGVAPPHFVGASRGDLGIGEPGIEIWVPLVLADLVSTPVKDSPAGRLAANERYMSYTGRLRDGVDRAQAESQAQIVAARIAAARPREGAGAWANVTGVWLNNPDGFGATIATVLAVPGIVLAIACLNAANLLLARGTRRAREFAVRLALGATRWRIVRLLLVDSVLLSLVAAAASLPLVHWSLSLVTVFFKLPMPIDGRVLAFTMSIAVVSAIAFSLAPALRLAAVTPGAALGSSRVGDDGPGRSRIRRVLVVVQIALSLGLLATGTQLVTFVRAEAASAGTDPTQLLMASFDTDQLRMDRPRSEAFYRRLLDRVSTLPEADGTGLARKTTLWTFGRGKGESPIIVWRPEDPPRKPALYLGGYADGELFRAAGLRVLEGRAFTKDDILPRPRVAIVNRPAAETLFGGPALGRTIRVAARTQPRTDYSQSVEAVIVGIVEPSMEPAYSRNPVPAVYVPVPLEEEPKLTLYVRSNGSTEALAAGIRQAVADIDNRVPPIEIRTLAEVSGQRQLPDTLGAQGLTILGFIGLLLATGGLYGVMSYLVSLRSREIGVRLALGADPRTMLRMTLREAMTLAAIGAAIGAAGAVVISKVVQSQMHGAKGMDLGIFAASVAVLGAAMLLASAIPARRASLVDPITVLRQE